MTAAPTRLIIARHGNTFEDGQPPRRIGIGTDMGLTDKGWDQARAIGRWMKAGNCPPDAVFCSNLTRTKATAQIAMVESGRTLYLQQDAIFNEIDYGPDENRTEEEVIRRIGKKAIEEWDENGIVPPGWHADPKTIRNNWQEFGARILNNYPGCTILVVTSNGIARFAPCLTGDFDGFRKTHPLKIATGALCVLESQGGPWTVKHWNVTP